MTGDEIEKLDHPVQSDYDEKIWSVVAFAREWALTQGKIADRNIVAQLERHYGPEEREGILARIRIMNFMNKFNNSWAGPIKKKS